MEVARHAFAFANVGLFGGLAVAAWRQGRRTQSDRLRILATSIAGIALIFVVGNAQALIVGRLALVSASAGLRATALDWTQLVLSVWALVVMGYAVAAYRRAGYALRRTARFAASQGAVGQAIVAPTDDFSARERDVLEAMRRGLLSDRELAGELSVSPATAATHVRNMLRKTGLHARRDLLLVDAGMMRGRGRTTGDE